MSESIPAYSTENQKSLPQDVLERHSSPKYRQPEPEEVRLLLKLAGWTGSQAADLVGAQSRSVRRWTSPKDKSTYQAIPYSAWRLLLIEAGII